MAITAAELMVRVGADTAAAERGLQSMGSKVQNAGRAMTQTGLAMTAGITAPLMGIAAAALNSAADFEQSMDVLQQVTGASTGTMEQMIETALKLGAETSFSADEAAEDMLELAKAGMETDEVLDSIAGVMDLAAAGGIALADAANITANALNAFSLEASEADRVANLLAGGANASSADISDLSQGLAQAGFAFANANQPIENLVASLSLLTNVGLTGSDAGTALKNAFMRLMNPSKEARAVMKALNLEFYDASGQMKALPEMIGMMNEAFADMTPQQRDAALSTLFLSDGMKAMIPLLDAGTEGFNEMVDAVSASGQAQAVAGARMKGLRGAIEYLKGSVDSFLIGAARPSLDFIGDLIRQGADLLTALGNLPPEITNMALAFGALLAVAGPVALAIGGLISAFTPLTAIILAATVAVAALAAAWSADFMGIQGAAQGAWDTITGLFNTVTTQAQTVADAIGRAFAATEFPTLEELWADFSAGDFAALATKIASTAYELMVNLDAELHITATAKELGQKLVDAVTRFGNAVRNVDFVEIAKKWGNDFLRVLYTEAPNLVGVASTWGKLLSNKLEEAETDFSAAATKWANDMATEMENTDYTAAGKAAGDKVADAIEGAFAAMETAGAFFDSVYRWANQAGLDMRARIIEGLEQGNLLSSIDNFLTELDTSFDEFMTGVMTQLQERASAWVFELPELAIPRPKWMDEFFSWIDTADKTLGGWIESADAWANEVNKTFNGWIASAGQWVTSVDQMFLGFLLAADAWAISVNQFFTTWLSGAQSWIALVTQSLSAWLAGSNTWIGSVGTTLTGWISSAQLWILNVGATLTSWLNRAIGWVASLLTAPPWVDTLVSFAASAPGWVASLFDWTPAWLDDLFSWTPSLPEDIDENAKGTRSFKGGMTWVGEQGPELVSLPKGTRIWSNPESMAMASAVTIGAVHIHNDMDVEVLAATIARRISQGGRR